MTVFPIDSDMAGTRVVKTELIPEGLEEFP